MENSLELDYRFIFSQGWIFVQKRMSRSSNV